MPTYETLLADVLRLPVAERIRLIDAIWETLPDDSMPPLSNEWIAEIQRRSSEIDAGAAETISWEQMKAEALCRLSGALLHDDELTVPADELFQTLDADESEN